MVTELPRSGLIWKFVPPSQVTLGEIETLLDEPDTPGVPELEITVELDTPPVAPVVWVEVDMAPELETFLIDDVTPLAPIEGFGMEGLRGFFA